MNQILAKWNLFRKQRFVKYGLPCVVLVIGGSIYLEQFSKLKYQFGKQSSFLTREQMVKEGLELRDKSELTLEAQYEKLKELDIDNWEQIRGPRPWEPETMNKRK